ncbi:MAG: hypothetical protein GC168_08255 [Candidatus Hydrogenedens sp.]|nr:hypothetical protein [Candidatus Hydrogenedens sp.]
MAMEYLAEAVGSIAAVIFFGRFYVQWYYSERAGRSVVPVGFWYMSVVGALLLFGYGVYKQSPVGVLSYSFNIVVYARNLVHVWRRRGRLTPARNFVAHGIVALVCAVALGLLAMTWLSEFHETRDDAPIEVARTWAWIMVGVAGQVLFASRFLIQWVVTEVRKKSTIPTAFWYLSVAASLLQIASYTQRAEWVYVFGLVATLPVYARNIWLIHVQPEKAAELAAKAEA